MDTSDKEIHMNTTKMYIDEYENKVYTNSKGQYHRLNGPAIEYLDEGKEWWVNGELSRVDEPACEYSNGTKFWYKEGKRHRLDGPACEYANRNKYWYILNQYLEEKEFNSWISRIQKFI